MESISALTSIFMGWMMLFGTPIIGGIVILLIIFIIFRKAELTVEAYVIPIPILIYILADAGFLPYQLKYIMIFIVGAVISIALIKMARA